MAVNDPDAVRRGFNGAAPMMERKTVVATEAGIARSSASMGPLR